MALRDELEVALGALEADSRVKAVILTGGAEAFSAGFDLKEVIETDFRASAHRAVEFTERTYFFKKPLVVAVAGPAFAGGFDLALSGDVIIAAEGASFGRPEIRFGINPLMTKLWLRVRMPRALPPSLTGAAPPPPPGGKRGLAGALAPGPRPRAGRGAALGAGGEGRGSGGQRRAGRRAAP